MLTSFAVMTACKKECKDCHYERNGAEVEMGEYCGDDIATAEADGIVVDDTLWEVHCGEH